jgi:hypothetical protein
MLLPISFSPEGLSSHLLSLFICYKIMGDFFCVCGIVGGLFLAEMLKDKLAFINSRLSYGPVHIGEAKLC